MCFLILFFSSFYLIMYFTKEKHSKIPCEDLTNHGLFNKSQIMRRNTFLKNLRGPKSI